MHKGNLKKIWLWLILAYLGLTIIFTFPLILNFRTAFPSDGGDAIQYLWNLWWTKFALLDLKTNPFFSNYIYYPWGTSLLYNTFTPLRNFVSIPLQLIFGLIIANNILIFGSFILSAFFMFLLAYELTKHKFASFMAGMSYAFSPYVFAHLRGHYNFTSIEFFPLLLLLLIKLWQKPNIKKAFFLGLVLIGLLLTDYFYLFCGILLVLFFVAFHLKEKKKIGDFLSHLFLSGAILGVVLLPIMVTLYSTYLGNEFYLLGGDRYTTDLASFFIPHCVGTFWRRLFKRVNLSTNITCGFSAGFTEGIVYLGIIPVFFLLRILRKRRFVSRWQKFAFFAGIFSLVLSLGDELSVMGWATGAKMPYYLLSLIPFLRDFRVSGRLTVLVILFFSLVLVFEIKDLLPEKNSSNNRRLLLYGVIFLVGLVDLFSAPILIERRRISQFYKSLREDKREIVILDIPLAFWRDPGRSVYYQTIHQKPILGGFLSRLPRKQVELYKKDDFLDGLIKFQDELYSKLNLEKPIDFNFDDFIRETNIKTFQTSLLGLNIDYLVIHNEFFIENELEQLLYELLDFFKGEFEIFYKDDLITVYQVV